MVFTAASTTAFFTDQMELSPATRVRLQQEGITTIDDLARVKGDIWQKVNDNMSKPVWVPVPGGAAGAMMRAAPPTYGAMSQNYLKVASDLVRYYNEVGRTPTPGNMVWTHVMSNFEVQWEALKAKKLEDIPDVPKITLKLPVMKWTDAFKSYLERRIGARNIPLSYVIRADAAVPVEIPALIAGQPYSGENGSLETELITRASHVHNLFKTDNATVFHCLVEATMGLPYSNTLKGFVKELNGRGAWLSILSQYAGKDKYQAEIHEQEQFLYTREWKGNGNQTLDMFTSMHRSAFTSLQACAEHVRYQLPNERSRVTLLLKAIKTPDPGMQAAMSMIKQSELGMMEDFERAVSHLLPNDPVAMRKTSGAKRDSSNISGTDGGVKISGTDGKPSRGKTGVHLRYHKKDEFNALTKEQKTELIEWRKANGNGNGNSNGNKFRKKGKDGRHYSKKQIDSLVSKRVQVAAEEDKAEEDMRAMMMACVTEAMNLPPPPPAAPVYPPNTQSALRAIIGRAKNKKG